MISTEPPATRYADADVLAREVVVGIERDLSAAIAARGMASLVVSGGQSPVKVFEILRSRPLDWSRVFVALVDERWVDTSDPSSNERLVRDVLLHDRAAAARFSGLKNEAASPDLGAAAAWRMFAGVPRPFDVVLLGMGDDGHTASLFPGSPHLERALDPDAAPGCIGMSAPAAPQARLSLNLAALVDSRRIVILITGGSKWLTYSKAFAPGDVLDMPVRSILRQRRVPVDVVWSP